MDKQEYESVKLNCDLWNAVRSLDIEIHKLDADARSSLLAMQTALREIAWTHLQSLKIDWKVKP